MVNSPAHDWFLRAWMQSLAVTQADLERSTGWDKRKTSHLVTGKQRFTRDTLNDAARALNVAPFELLLHPDDAHAIRRLRDSALRIAADTRRAFHHDAAELPPATGTGG